MEERLILRDGKLIKQTILPAYGRGYDYSYVRLAEAVVDEEEITPNHSLFDEYMQTFFPKSN